MQNNDSRLIRAAKRSIRAEVTLVIVIIVIASWSVYALCKLAFGGTDSVLGLSLTKLSSTRNVNQPSTSTEQKNSSILSGPNLDSEVKSPIYSQSTTIPTPQRSSNPLSLNSIQGLIASQNLNRHLLISDGLRPAIQSQPFAIGSNQLGNALPLAPYSPNLVHNLNIRQLYPNQLIPAQPIAPVVESFHEKSNVPLMRLVQPPAHEPEIVDYESNLPDYGPPIASADDHSKDRLAEESNRDPGEAVLETPTPPSVDEQQQQQQKLAPEAIGLSERDNSDYSDDGESQLETTTSIPDSEITNDTVESAEKSQDATNNDESEESQAQNAPEDKEPSPEEEENLKTTGLSIDEEVDRMTQPSLGSISQQDKPYNYRDAVQFDDSPNPGLVSKKPVESGALIAQFADPHKGDMEHKKRVKDRDIDLEVDHDIVRVGSTAPYEASELLKLLRKRRKLRRKERVDPPREGDKSSPISKKKAVVRREKRQLDQSIDRAPYEISGILNDINIDRFLERSFEKPASKGLTRAKISGRYSGAADEATGETTHVASLEAAPSRSTSKRMGSLSGRKRRRKRRKRSRNGFERRSDDEDDEDEESEDGESGNGEPNEQEENGTDSSPARDHLTSGYRPDPRYHYITSNDTTVLDLLNRQQLLDALRNSQLPAPTSSGLNSSQIGAVSVANSDIRQQIPAAPSQIDDHQQAGTLYSVDHGILLHPASNDDYSSKSMKKKHKKHEKKKEKKKMTVAVKKGGHKKKKHKKEEKKFIKEKKFKGAKKGKKVSKGKGGQGGKKGKKLYKDKGFKKKGFKNVYHKEEFGQKKSYFDEFRDKDFKKKWKKFDDKYNYAQMKKWQAKDVKGAKKVKDHGEKFKKHENGKWKKKYHKQMKEKSESSKKHKKSDGF